MVKIHNPTWSWKYYWIGCVPQDSVFGLILFILYVNSICHLDIAGLVAKYANDTYLLFSDKSWEEGHTRVTVSLNDIYKSLNARKLTLNKNKTVFMTLSINKLTHILI